MSKCKMTITLDQITHPCTCFLRHFESEKYFWQRSHFFLEHHAGRSAAAAPAAEPTAFFFFRWDATTWFVSWDICLNERPHTEHLNFLGSFFGAVASFDLSRMIKKRSQFDMALPHCCFSAFLDS